MEVVMPLRILGRGGLRETETTAELLEMEVEVAQGEKDNSLPWTSFCTAISSRISVASRIVN
jgi:hypothetical protein